MSDLESVGTVGKGIDSGRSISRTDGFLVWEGAPQKIALIWVWFRKF